MTPAVPRRRNRPASLPPTPTHDDALAEGIRKMGASDWYLRLRPEEGNAVREEMLNQASRRLDAALQRAERAEAERDAALKAARMLRGALRRQAAYWRRVPSGVDWRADPANESPDDLTAHLAGLAIREARAALRTKKPPAPSGGPSP